MEFIDARCTSCGASLEIIGRPSTIQCDYCQNHIVLSHAIHLASQDIEKIDDIAHAREHLSTAVEHNNIDDILTYAQQLKNWIPDDVESGYFYAYAKAIRNQPKYMEDFLNKVPIAANDTFETIIQHLIQRSDLRDKELIESFIKKYYPSLLDKYLRIYEQRYHQEDQYANIPRDVFICHSSKQKDLAEKLGEVVEEEGYSAWISTRNLRPQDSDNYWHNIEDAIRKSKLVLVVSSKEAMVSKDVQKEIELALKHKKPLLEYKMDDVPHTMFFKHAFDGFKWIEGNANLNNVHILKERLFNVLYTQPEESNLFKDPLINEIDTKNNSKPPKVSKARKNKPKRALFLSLGVMFFLSLGILLTQLNPVDQSAINPIAIEPSSLTLRVGETFTLKSNILREGLDANNLIWESDDSRIAEIDRNGRVTAIRQGETEIIATLGSVSNTITIRVISLVEPETSMDDPNPDPEANPNELLLISFVPLRDAQEILDTTAPLEELLKAELAELGFSFKRIITQVGSSFEAVGEGLVNGTVDVGFLPGRTYALYSGDGEIDVILAATRGGLNKDSVNAADWNDGLPTEGDASNQVTYYRSLLVAGPSPVGRTLANKVNSGQELTWEDFNSATWCIQSPTSSSGTIYPSVALFNRFGNKISDLDNTINPGGFGPSMESLSAGNCDVATIYADARRDYAEIWTTDYGRPGSIWEETDVVLVTDGIFNDTISVSNATVNAALKEALKQAFINIIGTEEGLNIFSIYSHQGYKVVTDADYEVARTAQSILQD
jgi:phosphonate transport system substrate-binding protein